MNEYKEVVEKVKVPPEAGVEGLILSLRGILKMPRVMGVSIDPRGEVTYTRFVRQEDPRKTVEIDFDSIAPWAIVRNGDLSEIDVFDVQDNAAICIARMFETAALDQVFPVAFITGANSGFAKWHAKTTGVKVKGAVAYGLPVIPDRFVPDEVIILAAAYGRSTALIDTRRSYKILMPPQELDFEVPVERQPPPAFTMNGVPGAEDIETEEPNK